MTSDVNSTLGISGLANAAGNLLVGRYLDAYRVARAIIVAGTAAKVIGWILGAVAVVVGFSLGSQVPGDGSVAIKIAFFIAGAILIVAFIFLGILIKAIGEVLRASLDTAVHTCPLLDSYQKMEALGLQVMPPQSMSPPRPA